MSDDVRYWAEKKCVDKRKGGFTIENTATECDKIVEITLS